MQIKDSHTDDIQDFPPANALSWRLSAMSATTALSSDNDAGAIPEPGDPDRKRVLNILLVPLFSSSGIHYQS